MEILVDSHAHIYPFFNIVEALDHLVAPATRRYPGIPRIACLAERYGYNLFDELVQGRVDGCQERYLIEVDQDGDSLQVVCRSSNVHCFILPGRQVVTAENIEILALNTVHHIADGMPAVDTVSSALEVGALPVVAWAPGKWFFRRRAVVEHLLKVFNPRQLALGDSSLRPVGWPTPVLMRRAVAAGYRVLCGSDPLPFAGEEKRLGCYMSAVKTGVPLPSPRRLISSLLANQEIVLYPVGSRGSPVQVAARIARNAMA